MVSVAIFFSAALAEISGCFAFWSFFRRHKSAFWLLPGLGSLILFAFLLTLVDSNAAGRVYATYGGIYICSSLLWLWRVEGVQPDLWEVTGTGLSPIGARLILCARGVPESLLTAGQAIRCSTRMTVPMAMRATPPSASALRPSSLPARLPINAPNVDMTALTRPMTAQA